jgi:hypothetical protein
VPNAVKQEASSYRTSLDSDSIRKVLRDVLGSKVKVTPLKASALDDPSDLAITATKSTMFGANSAIQVHVTNAGDHRTVTLVALGSSGLARMQGVVDGIAVSDVVKLSGGRTMVSEVVEGLRRADSSLRQIS